MATFSAPKGKAGATAKAVHAGDQTVVSKFIWGVSNATGDTDGTSATAAADDVIRFCKLPKGATIHYVALHTDGRQDGAYKLGTNTSASAFIVTTSGSANLTETVLGLPWYVSISDEAAVYHEWLQATVVSAGFTLSDWVEVIVTYTMDD